jgi:glycosyltransferase involved in cell wall biosynthesis
LLAELDLLVHTARQEPLGRVLLEAGATGLPIIATDVGGTREIFPPNSNAALVISPNEPQALATAIADLMNDESTRQQLGHGALQRIQTEFDLEKAAPKLVDHYLQAILQQRNHEPKTDN